MTNNILVVEDNPVFCTAITKIIEDLHLDTLITCVHTAEEAYQVLATKRINLFILDIILNSSDSGDVSGLHLADNIRQMAKYKYTPIIFITSLEDPKLYTYSQLHCYEYIEKPFNSEHVQKTIREALEIPVAKEEDKRVYFRKDGIIYSKHLSEIIYIESVRRKIIIHCINDVLEIPYKSTTKILEELDSDKFIQCSRFAIVNKEYIDFIDYTNKYIKMKYYDTPIDIGRVLLKSFKQQIENG